MGFFYLGLFLIYVVCAVAVIIPVCKFAKNKWMPTLTVLFFLLFPTYDILIQKMAMTYYEKTQTLQEIKQTVDNPVSVYWEDNVWPGYDKNYRLWMIDHLLDGKHLNTLAMNGEDGRIYLYRFGKGDAPEVYEDAPQLPPLNFKVVLNPVQLSWLIKRYIWSDQIDIYDTRTGERIAFSRRYMGYSPRIYLVKVIGGYPFEGGYFVGDRLVYNFDDKVLFKTISKWPPDTSSRSDFSKGSLNSWMNEYIKKYRNK